MQYSCLSDFIDIRSKSTASKAGRAKIDLNAFGQGVDTNISRDPWRTSDTGAQTRFTTGLQKTLPTMQYRAHGLGQNERAQDTDPTEGSNLDSLQPENDWGMGIDMSMGSYDQSANDGFGWLTGLGAGEAFFGDGNANNGGDLDFSQDPVWSVYPSHTGSGLIEQEIDPRDCAQRAVVSNK
jgi:hypothetical protein